MNEASFASLSPSLLARKGGARPAMRPQHGGLLGSIGAGSNTDSLSDESLDDLGWNDMGDEHAPHHDSEAVKLTPSPVNEITAAEARQLDEQAGAKLAEFAVTGSAPGHQDARGQQDVLAKRIERKSPPILSDAIMSNDDDADQFETDSEYQLEDEAGYDAEDGLGFEDDSYDEDAQDAGLRFHATPRITAVKVPRPARAPRVAAVDQGRRAAFTLRLDPERHLKLRLASTITGRSAQQIVTDALDAFLGDMPELATLAAQVKRTGNEHS
ncbi:hypothetical protein [Allopontixanthobacter sp.]|uniref:hypothetical protein n=1 Tax=Allopontixanthobacter sp. TaxID=2906452 RepID=UPI003A0FC95F